MNSCSSQPISPVPETSTRPSDGAGLDALMRLLSLVSGRPGDSLPRLLLSHVSGLVFSSTTSMASPFIMNILLLRLNQLPDFFDLSCGLDWWDDAVVEATLGEDVRSRLVVYWLAAYSLALGCSTQYSGVLVVGRGTDSEVRELLKDALRLLILNNFRTPRGRRCGSGGDTLGVAEAGEICFLKTPLLAWRLIPVDG